MQILGSGSADLLTQVRDKLVFVRDNLSNIQNLEGELNDAFNSVFGAGKNPFHLTFQDDVLALDFDLGVSYSGDKSVNLDLKQIAPNIPGLTGALNLSSTSVLHIEAGANLIFGVSVDLSNVFVPTITVAANSGVSAFLNASADDLNILASMNLSGMTGLSGLPDVGIKVEHGSINLSLAAGLTYGDGGTVTGQALVDLPLFMVIGSTSLPIGGSTADRNGNGIADNSLTASASFDLTGLGPFDSNVPTFAGTFDLFAILNDPETVLLGLDGMFEGSITIRDGRPNATTPTVSLSVTRSGSTQTFTPFVDPNAPYSTTATSLKNYFANTGAYQETDIHLIGDVVGTVWTLNITSKNLNGDSVLRPFNYTAGANGDTPSMTVVAKRLSELVNSDSVIQLTAEGSGPEPIILGLQNLSDAYGSDAEVESLVDRRSVVANPTVAQVNFEIFENAVLIGGASNNTMLVNDSDGHIQVNGDRPVSNWRGTVTLDNARSSGALNEYYLITLKGTGARYSISDSGGSDFNELYVLGTNRSRDISSTAT